MKRRREQPTVDAQRAPLPQTDQAVWPAYLRSVNTHS
jgi:hypothetical protein